MIYSYKKNVVEIKNVWLCVAQEKLLTINSILLIDRKAFPKRICREGGQLIPLDFPLFYNPNWNFNDVTCNFDEINNTGNEIRKNIFMM